MKYSPFCTLYLGDFSIVSPSWRESYWLFITAVWCSGEWQYHEPVPPRCPWSYVYGAASTSNTAKMEIARSKVGSFIILIAIAKILQFTLPPARNEMPVPLHSRIQRIWRVPNWWEKNGVLRCFKHVSIHLFLSHLNVLFFELSSYFLLIFLYGYWSFSSSFVIISPHFVTAFYFAEVVFLCSLLLISSF